MSDVARERLTEAALVELLRLKEIKNEPRTDEERLAYEIAKEDAWQAARAALAALPSPDEQDAALVRVQEERDEAKKWQDHYELAASDRACELMDVTEERDEALDVVFENVYGGVGRWLEPDAAPLVDLLKKHNRLPGREGEDQG